MTRKAVMRLIAVAMALILVVSSLVLAGTRSQSPVLAQDAPPTPVAPDAITIGATVVVAGLGNVPLDIKATPSLSAETRFSVTNGETYLVVAGPEQADGYVWWQIRDPENMFRMGWALAEYLRVLPPPTATPVPSDTPTITPLPTSTPTPTAAPLAAAGAYEPITADNLDTIVELQRIGRGYLETVAWSPDGSWLAVGSSIGVWLYQGSNLDAEPRLIPYSGIRKLEWSPDGTRLAVQQWSHNQVVPVLDIATGTVLYELVIEQARSLRVDDIDWSPQGDVLAMTACAVVGDNGVCASGGIWFWDTDTGELLTSWESEQTSIIDIEWSPDGTRLVSIGGDMLKVWSLAYQSAYLSVEHLNARSVAWSPDGNWLASGADRSDAELRIWDAATGELLRSTNASGSSRLLSIEWSPDVRYLATVSRSNQIMIWDASTLEPIDPEGIIVEGNYSPRVSWSADGTQIAIVSRDSANVQVWDVFAMEQNARLPGYTFPMPTIDWSPDSTLLAVAGHSNEIVLWNPATGNASQRLMDGYIGPVNGVDWSPDGRWLVAAHDARLSVWDIQAGRRLFLLEEHVDDVYRVVWSPDGKQFASASRDGTVRVWDVSTGTSVQALETGEPCYSLAWSPDGQVIAAGCGDGVIRQWKTSDWSELIRLGGSSEFISLVWSPDNHYLASVGQDGLYIWVPDVGQELIHYIEAYAYGIFAKIDWSPDSQFLVAGGWSKDTEFHNVVHVWQMLNGDAHISLPGHAGFLTAAVWSPDGTRLVSASEDGDIRIWGIPAAQTSEPIFDAAYYFSDDSGDLLSLAYPTITQVGDQQLEVCLTWRTESQFLSHLNVFVHLRDGADQLIAQSDGPVGGDSPTDSRAPILPSRNMTIEYEGQDYQIFKVPTDSGMRELALVTKGRKTSEFFDPEHPEAGLIEWEGNWRQLEPVTELAPAWLDSEIVDQCVLLTAPTLPDDAHIEIGIYSTNDFTRLMVRDAAGNVLGDTVQIPSSALPSEISVLEAATLRDQGAFILDVRQPEEWTEIHIPIATLIPLDELQDRLSEIPRNQRVVVVCRNGNRSALGRDILLSAGYEQITSMAGGLSEWVSQGLPTTTGP